MRTEADFEQKSQKSAIITLCTTHSLSNITDSKTENYSLKLQAKNISHSTEMK